MFAYSVALSLLILVGAGFASAAEPKVYEEKKLLYTDIKDGKTTWVQSATQFFPVKSVASIPSYMDLYGITKSQNDIRSFVVVRSSFYLPLGLSEIRQRMANPMVLSQYSKHFKVPSCAGNACSALIKTTFANLNLKLTHGQVDKSNVSGPWLNVFSSLHQPDFVAAQEFTDIEAVFGRGSSFSAFYNMGSNLTWVQSYQLFSIKNSAYDKASYIPFFNLEKNIRGVIQDLILGARSSILQQQKYAGIDATLSRLPAGTDYDRDLYEQKTYQLYDSDGDEALIQRATVVPKNVLKTLFGDGHFTQKNDPWLPEAWETADPLVNSLNLETPSPADLTFQGRERPIKLKEFSEMLNQVLLEESQRGIQPFRGLFHEWSTETREKHQGKNLVVSFSKLFICLSLGFTNRFMKTGQEKELWQWMMTQDYNSITFPELFRASYRIHNGDVYLGLLTIENLLAANWRYGERESLPAIKRLRPIASGYNYAQDKFGTWYHFFGMILYGYRTGSGFQSNLVGRAEALGANVLSGGVDQTQKQWFNKLGGYIGEELRASVETKSYKKHIFNPEFLKESHYLNSEDFRDRLPIKLSPQLKMKVLDTSSGEVIGIVLKNSSAEDLVNCTVDVIPDLGNGYYSPARERQTGITIKAQGTKSLHLSLPKHQGPRGLRVFVEQCQQGTPQATEWVNRFWQR